MANGIDLSNNNDEIAGVAAIKSRAVDFVYAKASESDWFVDRLYKVFRGAAFAAKKPFGAYLFLHNDVPGGDQVAEFLKAAKPHPGDLQPVVDSETPGRTAPQVTLNALDHLRDAGYDPILYGSTSFLKSMLGVEPRLGQWRVWQAEYGPVLHRIPGLNAIAWQYTDAEVIGKGRFDGDRLLIRNLDMLEIPKLKPVKPPVIAPTLTPLTPPSATMGTSGITITQTGTNAPSAVEDKADVPTAPPPPKPAIAPMKPARPKTVYYTYKKDVPRPGKGQLIDFTEGKGYYVRKAKPGELEQLAEAKAAKKKLAIATPQKTGKRPGAQDVGK